MAFSRAPSSNIFLIHDAFSMNSSIFSATAMAPSSAGMGA
jgi:hypothetical protein